MNLGKRKKKKKKEKRNIEVSKNFNFGNLKSVLNELLNKSCLLLSNFYQRFHALYCFLSFQNFLLSLRLRP